MTAHAITLNELVLGSTWKADGVCWLARRLAHTGRGERNDCDQHRGSVMTNLSATWTSREHPTTRTASKVTPNGNLQPHESRDEPVVARLAIRAEAQWLACRIDQQDDRPLVVERGPSSIMRGASDRLKVTERSQRT